MQFRAVCSNVSLPAEEWFYVRDVQCPVCYALFRLWAPVIWTQQTDIAVHADWLTLHLMNTCLNHEGDMRTPSPTLEKFHTGLKKLAPKLFKKLKMQDSESQSGRHSFRSARTFTTQSCC